LDGLVAVAAKRLAPLAAQKGVNILAVGASNPERNDICHENKLVRNIVNRSFNPLFRRDNFRGYAESRRRRAVI
jgi:hypothetical protein